MAKWKYHVESFNISDRWSARKQREEVVAFGNRLNELGKQGWEMINYEAMSLTSAFTGNVKGYAYLLFFKQSY